MNLRKKFLYFISFSLIAIYIYVKWNLYIGSYTKLIEHALIFLVLSGLLIFTSWTAGKFLRETFLKSQIYLIDTALGFGSISLFLSFYLKFSINLVIPIIVLAFFFIWGLRQVYLNKRKYFGLLKHRLDPLIVAVYCILLLDFSMYDSVDGFLFVTRDFDSGFYHVAFPRIVNFYGEYFLPDWLRGLFIPQLMHNWYIFLLKIFSNDLLYLKIVNVLILFQVAVIFLFGIRNKIIATVLLVLLSLHNEFRVIIINTNLDAGLCLFFLAEIYLFLIFWKEPSLSNLAFLTIIAGFSSGQKHFGLMFSASVLIFSFLRMFYFQNTKSPVFVNFLSLFRVGLLFPVTFVPFYLHNLLAGNNLLFPFFGSLDNTYGWDRQELIGFTTTVIHQWGLKHDLPGFFSLALDLLESPGQYAFDFSNLRVLDILPSLSITFSFILLMISFFMKRWDFFSVSFLMILHYFSWYRGSQVIRYMLPITINFVFIFGYFLNLVFQKYHKRINEDFIKIPVLAIIFLSLFFQVDQIRNYDLPITKEQRREFLRPLVDAKPHFWISENVPHRETIYHVSPAGMSVMMYFPEYRYLGDFFGPYKYEKILQTSKGNFISVAEWPDIANFVKKSKIDYFIFKWNAFSREAILPDNNDFSLFIPNSTQNCLEHVYSNGEDADVFKVIDKCKEL